jgi:hypothetical protein
MSITVRNMIGYLFWQFNSAIKAPFIITYRRDLCSAVNQSLIQRGIFHCSQSLTESVTYKIYNPHLIHILLLFHEIYAEKTLLITLSAK